MSAERAARTVTIVNRRGLHARASAKFVHAVAELGPETQVQVVKDGVEAAGGSILGLMMLGAAKGDSVEIVCTGGSCEQALGQLCALVESGFDED